MVELRFGRICIRSLCSFWTKLSSSNDVERAGLNGYKITLHSRQSVEENIEKDSVGLEQTIWDIPNTVVGRSPESDAKNGDLLEKLKKSFPSLSATISYKKLISTNINAAEPAMDGTRAGPVAYIPVVEEVFFHDVAAEMLMEIYLCEDSASVLAASELSLKAVHVLAIALRGFSVDVLGQCCNPPIEPRFMERAALGSDVTWKMRKR